MIPDLYDLATMLNHEVLTLPQFSLHGVTVLPTPESVAKASQMLAVNNAFYWTFEDRSTYYGIDNTWFEIRRLELEDIPEVGHLHLFNAANFQGGMEFVSYEGDNFVKTHYTVDTDSPTMPLLIWPDATSIDLTDSSVGASILAPLATVTLHNSVVAGHIWAKQTLFSSSVPEPATLSIVAVALMAIKRPRHGST